MRLGKWKKLFDTMFKSQYRFPFSEFQQACHFVQRYRFLACQAIVVNKGICLSEGIGGKVGEEYFSYWRENNT